MHRLAALLCLIALAWVAPAAAQTPIHRCIDAHGQALFTDQPCMALQATPVAPTASSIPILTEHTVRSLCAANLDTLREGVIDAFAGRDANRLAGMMLWNGYGRGAAIADIRSLTQVMKQPLLDVDVPQQQRSEPASGSSLDDPFRMDVTPDFAAPPSNQLVLHIADNDGSGSPRELRFNIVRQAGCLWLRNTD